MTRTLLPTLLLVSACLDTTGTICTDEAVFGITARLTDSVTGQPAAAEASVIARDGPYEEVLEALCGDNLHQVGAVERPGTYEITATRPGYQPWARGGVQVVAGPCHVVPVTVEVRLIPTGR